MTECSQCHRPVFKLEEGVCARCIKIKDLPKGCGYCRSYIPKHKVFCNELCEAKGVV